MALQTQGQNETGMTVSLQQSSLTDSLPSQVLPLAEATRESLCGGKAAGLAKALELGLPVPDGYVVTNHALQQFLETNDLGSRIDALISSMAEQEITKLRTASRTISGWILDTSLPPGILDSLEARLEITANCQPLIVRSSAVGEDSTEASFAGQLDSFLDIRSIEELEVALKQCWASYWSERSLSYQVSTGKSLQGMAVVVQQQVDSRVAGVLFTKSPMQHAGDSHQYMLGEYCYGQGTKLVSGQINPGRFHIFRHDLSWEKLSAPEQPDSEVDSSDLDSAWIRPLADAALKLETYHQRPQDIEWSIDHFGNLFIVQSRPIVLQSDASSTAALVRWSNANVRENFPDPITPLLYSVASAGYRNYFRNLGLALGISRARIAAMDAPLTNIIGVHGARIYYNLSSIHSVIRMAPFGDRLVSYFNSFVGATETAPASPGDRQFLDLDRSRIRQFLELARIAVKSAWQFLFLKRRISRFETRVDRFAAATSPAALQSMGIIELRNNIRAFMDIRLNRWTDAGLADAASMICYGILNSLLRGSFPENNQSALPNNLLKGVTGLVSSEPVFDLWILSRMILQDEKLRGLFTSQPGDAIVDAMREPKTGSALSEFSAAFDDYLEKWGFRCSGELMLTVPSFQENPAALIDILKTYLHVKGASPSEVLDQQKSQREEQTRTVLEQIAGNRNYNLLQRLGRKTLVRWFLQWTQGAISLRERARLKQALLYSRLRRIAIRMGECLTDNQLLAQADDIFYLTCQEIDELASSRAMFSSSTRDLVDLRRREHARLGAMEPPDSFVMEEGTYLDEKVYTGGNGSTAGDSGEGILEGTPACGGKIQGRATVLHDVSQADQLNAGDILITTQTDPGWAHVFFLIKGLIIERGGMLSHGAILAREFGIPAIVGVHNATGRIPQHATVYLDGDRGQAHVVE
jgi:pyruvate,water dikinase